MSIRQSEAFILRTYPYGEADLMVSFFARDAGKLKGPAKHARKSKRRFGAGLDRLCQVRVEYFYRETRELVNIRSTEIIAPVFEVSRSYEAGIALDYIAEVSDQLLPMAEVNEYFYRLLIAVVDQIRLQGGAGVWPSITYFSLWAVRLSGFLPEMRLSEASQDLVEAMLRSHLRDVPVAGWQRDTAADLRRSLIREIENHLERRLLTVALLDSLA